MRRGELVSSSDVALLRALARERSVVRASRELGFTRDRAVYRIARLARAFGGPVVESARGGAGHGRTVLTPLGDRIARGGFSSVELLDGRPVTPLAPANLLHGVYHRRPAPTVVVGGSLRLGVAFVADDGAPVSVVLDPEAVVVALRRFPSSARNVLEGRIVRLGRGEEAVSRVVSTRVGPVVLRVAVTARTVEELGLRPGTAVYLYVKATSLRRVGDAASPGPPPS